MREGGKMGIVIGRIGMALRRAAVLSVHTSPLDPPGTGDAGGMNVYIVQTATRLARRGVEVEIFTRATSSGLPPVVELAPGVTVRHITAGPYEGLAKNDLPAQLCAFTAGVLRAEAHREPGYYDVVHSHYWLSGQVGWLARDRWGVPLVHTAHTLGKVKNAALARGDDPEPHTRVIGEEQVVAEADRLVANTPAEVAQLVELYGADPARTATIAPGVDLELFTPGSRDLARARLGLPRDAVVLAFIGRIQPLKGPDVLLRATAEMVRRDPALRKRLRVLVVGGPSGSGLAEPVALHSYSESFGLVALEAQACGTPVVAAHVGGLPVAVADGVSGRLVSSHHPSDWADVLADVSLEPQRRGELAAGAARQAPIFSWERTTEALLRVYADAVTAYRVDALREVAV
jgi:D-inositol-3-phosphate glycosyltransferase